MGLFSLFKPLLAKTGTTDPQLPVTAEIASKTGKLETSKTGIIFFR
jgi:hypothetical protein